MAAHTVAADKVSAPAKTLVAATADSVTFTSRTLSQVRVFSNGVAEMWVSVDGSAATVAGTHCYFFPAYPCSRLLTVAPQGGATDLSLISSGTPQFTVEAA